jgi:hypothetical protein
MKELWLGVFASPTKDRIALRAQLPKILKRDVECSSDLEIKINSYCWYFSWAGGNVSFEELICSLRKVVFYRKIQLFPNFSRPVLFYYARENGKEEKLSCLKDIPVKKTEIIKDQPENELFPYCFAALDKPKIRSIPGASLEIDRDIPRELYEAFFRDNLCLFDGNDIRYVGNEIDNSVAVIRNLNYHLRDLKAKIQRDLEQPERIIQLPAWQKNDLDQLAESMKFDVKLAKRVAIGLDSDRNCEIVTDFPRLGGLVSCLRHRELKEYVQAIWQQNIDNKIAAIILFVLGKKQLLRALEMNKMPSGRGDPFSIKRQLRLLVKIILRWKIDLAYLPEDPRVYKLLKREILKTQKKNKSFKVKYLLQVQDQEISLKNYEILSKLHRKTKDGDFDSKREPLLEKKIKNMEPWELDLVAGQLIDLKEKVKINGNSYGRGLIGSFLKRAQEYLDEN